MPTIANDVLFARDDVERGDKQVQYRRQNPAERRAAKAGTLHEQAETSHRPDQTQSRRLCRWSVHVQVQGLLSATNLHAIAVPATEVG